MYWSFWERIQCIQYSDVFVPQDIRTRKGEKNSKWTNNERTNERMSNVYMYGCMDVRVYECSLHVCVSTFVRSCVCVSVLCSLLSVYYSVYMKNFINFRSYIETVCLLSFSVFLPLSRFVYIFLSLSRCVPIVLSSERVVWKREKVSFNSNVNIFARNLQANNYF